MVWRVLLVDDEALARARLRALLDELCQAGACVVAEIGEASNAVQAMQQLQHAAWDVLLLDIQMPGLDGLQLAERLRHWPGDWPASPALVFVTAHTEHALAAFELQAIDYLTKPVRRERLQQALDKVARWRLVADTASATANGAAPAHPPEALTIHERGGLVRVPLADILYLKAESKYLTVRTKAQAYLYEGSLNELEQAHPGRWLRIHRNALVARHRVRALEKAGAHCGHDEPEGWLLRLDGVPEALAVSRRQLPLVRELLGA
ncbi:response regulator of the LytR/algR family [Serpentinimonas raichei]|uniref:Response regulator of the LytR/algR family n=1 Tax=Serpentinimonas raichei TaxID=1458425 RepID=A0A060NSA5_9BURK|nr:LytTR family DNA-binding domain-containing protein [Serpentinimonas raichei]BAO81779.1 response regulator of the LytR/algR family [Serpentinimonas raichei]